MIEKEFTPALGKAALTPLYDSAISLLTRENTWRNALLAQVAPTADDRILDVGCGTGSLVVKIKLLSPKTDIHGIDPDKEILLKAKAKAKKNAVSISFHQGFLSPESRSVLGNFSKIVSSLVLHQTPIEEKRNILFSIFRLLLPGGKLCIADYGLQRTALMKTLFRRTVQTIDGIKDTQPNAEGCIPTLMEEMGYLEVSETQVVPTLTGSISIYTARSVV